MRETVRVGLIALFVTALVTAQLIAVKVLALPLPVTLPWLGATALVPAGVLAYALTFFATDCYAELYGRGPASAVVNVGFAMNFVLLALVWLAISLPGSSSGVPSETFASVLGPTTNIVAGSLLAYIVSQHWDVFAFHAIRQRTMGRHLWLRNIGSTASSQLLDTAIFITVAFYAVPTTLGIGQALPGSVLAQLVVVQYLVKLLIALVDTPFVYAVVGYARSNGLAEPWPVD